jgi:hypothetical protein
MKRLVRYVGAMTALWLLCAGGALPAGAATLTVDPIEQTVTLGETVTMSIRVDGIDETSQLGSFLLEILYDIGFLAFDSADFGSVDPFNIAVEPNQLVDPIADGLLVTKDFGGGPGSPTLDPIPLQDASFILVALTFTTLQTGTQAIGLGFPQLYSVTGDPLDIETIFFGAMEVTVLAAPPDPVPDPVPEPSSLALLALGVAGLGFALRRRLSLSPV